MKKYMLFLNMLMLCNFSAYAGWFIKGPVDPVEELMRTGNGQGKDFSGRDLTEAIKKASGGSILNTLKFVASIVGLRSCASDMRVDLRNADLRGANLSGVNAMYVNFSGAQFNKNTNLTNARFTNGTVIFPQNANVENVKNMNKAQLSGAVFSPWQIETIFSEEFENLRRRHDDFSCLLVLADKYKFRWENRK